MDGDLLLSHRSDTTEYIVRRNLVSNLKNYQVLALRFLFNCFRRKQKGAILSEDKDMNFEIQVSIFLKAVTARSHKTTPILIITPTKNLWSWYYHLHKFSGLEVTRISAHNGNLLFQRNEHFIILSDENDLKHLRSHRDQSFYIVVVDQLEAFTCRDLIKGDYNIGLTNINFLRERDPRVLWKMTRWANPSSVGRETDFVRYYFESIGNFRQPYNETWCRITWNFNNHFRRPTADEKDDLETRISNFHMEHSDSFPPETKRTGKKREAKTKKPQGTPKRRKYNRILSPWSSDEEPVDTSIFIPTKNKSNLPKKRFNFNDPTLETSINNEDKNTSKPQTHNDSTVKNTEASLARTVNKNIEKFNKKLNKSPALALRSQRGIRKHVSANVIEDELLEEFESDFVPHQKMKKNKSASSLRKNAAKLIDTFVLEEFSRDFDLEAILEKSKRQNEEILGNISSFFETGNPRKDEFNSDLDLSKDLSVMVAALDNLDTSKGLDNLDTSKGLDNLDTSKDNLDTSKDIDNLDTSKGLDNLDTSNGLDNLDTSKGLDNLDTSKGLDNLDTSKGVDNLDTFKGLDNLDTSKGLDNLDTSKEQEGTSKSKTENIWTIAINLMNVETITEASITRTIPESKDEYKTSALKQTEDKSIETSIALDEDITEFQCILSSKTVEHEESCSKSLNEISCLQNGNSSLLETSLEIGIKSTTQNGNIFTSSPMEVSKISPEIGNKSTTKNGNVVISSLKESSKISSEIDNKSTIFQNDGEISSCLLGNSPKIRNTPQIGDIISSSSLKTSKNFPEIRNKSQNGDFISPICKISSEIVNNSSILQSSTSTPNISSKTENNSTQLFHNKSSSNILNSNSDEDDSFLLNIIRKPVNRLVKPCSKEDILLTLFGKQEENIEIPRMSSSQKTLDEINDEDFLTNLFHSSDKNEAEAEALLTTLLRPKTQQCSLKREEERRRILSSIFDDEDS